MVDPELERQFHDCEELLKYWQAFHEYYNMAVKGEGLTPENEDKFLQIKSRIAMLTDSFIDALKEEDQETLATGQGIQKIVEASITMKILSKMDIATVRKAQLEWNESYILLTDTIGRLANKREELKNISELQAHLSNFFSLITQKVTGFFRSGGFKLLTGSAIFLAICFLLFWVGLIHKMGEIKMSRPVYNAIIDYGYRSIMPDYPWAKVKYLAPFAWYAGKGYNDPEESATSFEDIGNRLARVMMTGTVALALKDNIEFVAQKVTSTLTGLDQKTAELYFFRMKDRKTAKDIMNSWEDIVAKNPAANIEKHYRLMNNKHLSNILVLIYSSDSDTANDIVVNVVGQGK